MHELFDDISRIVASPIPRRRVLRLIIGALAVGAVNGLGLRRAAANPDKGCSAAKPICCRPDGDCSRVPTVTCCERKDCCSKRICCPDEECCFSTNTSGLCCPPGTCCTPIKLREVSLDDCCDPTFKCVPDPDNIGFKKCEQFGCCADGRTCIGSIAKSRCPAGFTFHVGATCNTEQETCACPADEESCGPDFDGSLDCCKEEQCCTNADTVICCNRIFPTFICCKNLAPDGRKETCCGEKQCCPLKSGFNTCCNPFQVCCPEDETDADGCCSEGQSLEGRECCREGQCDVCRIYALGGGGKFVDGRMVALVRCDLSGTADTDRGDGFTSTRDIEGRLSAFDFRTRTQIESATFSLISVFLDDGDFVALGEGSADVDGVPTDIEFEATKTGVTVTFNIADVSTGEVLASGIGEPGRAAFQLAVTEQSVQRERKT